MVYVIDIETIPNMDMVSKLPEPDVKFGNIKDPIKIAEKKAEAKANQIASMALDPLFGRICAYRIVQVTDDETEEEASLMIAERCISEATDKAEGHMLSELLYYIESANCLVTFNGTNFDVPYILKRAAILNVPPSTFLVKVNSESMYNTKLHCDLMLKWCGRHEYVSLDTLSGVFFGEHKTDVDFRDFPQLLTTPGGRETILNHCRECVGMTAKLYKKLYTRLFVM